MDKVKEVLLKIWESDKFRAALKGLVLIVVGIVAESLGLTGLLGL